MLFMNTPKNVIKYLFSPCFNEAKLASELSGAAGIFHVKEFKCKKLREAALVQSTRELDSHSF